MNQLLLLRHAKSDWGDSTLADIDRPLNARGRLAATAMGAVVRELAPDLALCSPSKRTRETLERLDLDCPIRIEERIYDASVERLLEVVTETGDEAATLLLVGHMPGVARLAAAMSEGDGGEERLRLDIHYPTAALTVIELAEGRGRVTRFVTPRELI